MHRTPSLINKAKETIYRSFITNRRKRRQTTDLEWGSDLSAFLKVEKSEWISLNQPELKPRRITQEPRLLQPQPQPPYFPFNGSQSLSSEATCTVLPAICGTAFPSMKFVSAVMDRNRERRKSGLLTESILEKLQLNEKPVRGSYGSYLRAPEATIIVAEGGLSTEPTLLLSEPSTANASKESNALQTPLEVSQMATAKPPKSNHVLIVRENSEDTEKKPSRVMSSSAVPTAGYSTLFLGSDIALKEGFSEPTGQPPPWFPKRPRRLTADTQLGVLLRPAVPAGQPHVPPSFMIASRATADSRTSLPTNQSASKLAAHVKSRSSLQAFLPTTKPRQARLPSLTVQSKGFLPTDSLHLDVRLQAAVPASPMTEVPGGVTVERSPEQKENEDIPELERRISNFEQTATESTVLRSLSLEVALTTDQLEGLNTLYLSQPATVVFPPLQMSESVEGSLSADAARERLNFINRLKHQHTKSQFDILTGPALTRQSEDFNDAVSAVVELGDTWKQMVFLEMTADLVGLINKNGEYVQTVLLPRCDEQLNLVKELQSCVASIAELRPKTINPTKIVQLLGMSLGSREERTVLPGGLTEDEYKRRLKSRLLVLVPRLYMRRNTTLDMATSLVTRLCDVAAKVTAYLIGCEHTSAAMGYRNLTIDVLFDGLLTGAVFGTPLAGNSGISLSKNAKAPHGTAGPWIRAPGLESGLPSRTGPSQNSGIALTDALGRLLGSSGQVQEEALRQILQAVIGELGSSSQLISMLGSEVLTGGDVDADTLRRLLQSGRGEDVIQRLVDSLESQEDMLAPAGAQAALLRQLLMSLGAQEDRTESKTTSLNRLTSARGEDMDLPRGVGDSRGSLPGIPAGEDSDSMGLKVRFEEGDSTPDGTGDGTARIIREGSFQPNRQTAEGIDDTSEDTRHGSLLSAASRGEFKS
ncbi:unnamed protein product [Schistocephalus solidus]|uniref:Uncharacterized protein n=1 Tax=Schistocephalus solidus TaxID=70667 RepID=A0A3P7BSU5_SCHSO|nr:unnamed protein product [Schistocephalus solidus]